ncbi:hypothetical protein QJR52_07150 [Clostridium baratii]|uniref:hypothetical protein n=1 Tax=Clostridium baratii TaxID=1561 RepID=UPI0030D4A1E6
MKDFRELLDANCIKNFKMFSYRVMKWIKVGNYQLSIQASGSHYCEPQQTLRDLKNYISMEVGIFKNNEWINIRNDSFFDDWKYRMEFLENYDGMVAGYVPINIIQSLYDYIEGNRYD